MDELLAEADAQLERVRGLVRQIGWEFSDLAPIGIGVGIAVAWGQENFTVISVSGGGASHAFITSGVVQGIHQDKLAALTACNERTGNNPEFPYFLHEAQVGWDILISHQFPVQLLIDVPQYFEMIVQGTARVAEDSRSGFQAALGGETFEWSLADVNRILIDSLI